MIQETGFIYTNDKVIRKAMRVWLGVYCEQTWCDQPTKRVIEELGIIHGEVRIDIAVLDDLMHGYELKSDLDTLDRLPEQMRVYNSVFDRVTLVVGKKHVYEALKIVPEWWGIKIAKIVGPKKEVVFYSIREASENNYQDSASIASLLWKEEALQILEEIGHAVGVRSKDRETVYKRLAIALDKQTLKTKVRQTLCSRLNWRSDLQCTLSGD